jgi:hypothetical protein
MKKSILGLFLALLALTLATPAMALLLPLTYSNVSGSGTYGALQLEQTVINVVTFSANYNPAVFTPTVGSFGVMDVYLNLSNTYSGGTPTLIQLTNQNTLPNSWDVTQPVGGAHANGYGYFTLNATGGGNAGDRIPIAASTDPTHFTPLFSLTGSGLTVNDFLAFSKDNQGKDTEWMAAMHLAGYTHTASPTDGITSEFLATPIPSTVWLLGSGVLGLIGLQRRRGRKP